MPHYHPEAGGSWLKAVDFDTGPFVLFSGAFPRIVAGAVGTLQVPATLVRIFLSGSITPGSASGTVLSSVGPCWSNVPLLMSTPPGVADQAQLSSWFIDWDFRLVDHVLVVDPDAVMTRGAVTVSGQALVVARTVPSAGQVGSAEFQLALNP